MKRLVGIILSMCILTSLAINVNAMSGSYDNLTWDFSNGVLTLDGDGPMVVVSAISVQPERLTKPQWGSVESEIEEIIINEGVTTIGYAAFMDCENIKTITIPKSVKLIHSKAFQSATKLNTIYYSGSKSDWDKIEIDSNNENLMKANIIFGTNSSLPSSWAESEVNSAKNEGLVTDSVMTNYQADITREQFCEMVVRAYEKISGESAEIGNMYFSDTSNGEILKAANLGIVTGYGNSVFGPNDLITREQIATMLVRMVDKSVSYANINVYNNNYFKDGYDISDWAIASVNFAYDKGIMQGVGNNCIDPQANTTCEQAVLLVYRTTQEYIDSSRIFYSDIDNVKINDEEDAKNVIKSKSEEIGIKDVDKELVYTHSEEVLGNTFYHFQQIYNNIPVYGRSITVGAASSGNAIAISDNYATIDVDTSVKLKKQDIAEIIEKFYGDESTSYYIKGLTVYSLHDTKANLCWEVYVNIQNNTEAVFVSTSDRVIVDTISLTYYDSVIGNGYDIDDNFCMFNTYTEDNKLFYMEDRENGITVYDAENGTLEAIHAITDENGKLYIYDYDKEYFTDIDGNEVKYEINENSYITLKDSNNNIISESATAAWYLHIDKSFLTDKISKDYIGNYLCDNVFASVSEVTNKGTEWKNSKAVTVMDRISKLNSFYYDVFQRVGYDGKVGGVIAVINDSFNGRTNAYSKGDWNGTTLLSFTTDCSLSYDLIGHEYRHSVTDSIKDGLIYESEAGALNEAYSDIFGELFEDWVDDEQLNNSCDWIHNNGRNLVNPHESHAPDFYKGAFWADTSNPDENNDYGGVHTNQTVISHAAYLMSKGLVIDDSVEHLSNLQLAKLFHTTSYVLPSTCSFEEFSERLYIMANYMCENNEITDKQLLCVAKAFEYVGLPITEQSISGKVIDNTENYVNNATVNFSVNGVQISSVETDKNGNFSAKLPVGTYEIYVEKEGYTTATQGAKLSINEWFVLLDNIVLEKDVDDEDRLLNAFIEQVVGYNSDYLYFLPDDYDGDGTLEAFGITGWGLGEELHSNVNIWFVDANGNCNLVKSDTYGSLEGTLIVSNGKFLSWCVTAGGSGSQSILLGVKDGIFFEPNVSGEYVAFVGKGSDYIFSDDSDFENLNCNYVAYRSYFKEGGGHMWEPIAYDYDDSTREFIKRTLNDLKKLTQDEAQKKLEEWLGGLGTWVAGEENVLVCDGIYECNGKEYYQFRLKGWVFDHSTTLTLYVISADGTEMFEGECSNGYLDKY